MKKDALTKKPNLKKTVLMLIGIILFSVALAGCVSDTGQSDDQSQDQSGDGGDQELSGQIIIDGSSTVYPVSQAMAEEFKKQHPDVKISVTSSGTGGGFQKFVEGETDINDASRPIKPSESQKCKENGIEYIEFKIATDGITVVTNKNADWYDSMSEEELSEIWGPENPPQKWNEVNSNWPDKEMELYGPTSASGTFDFFTETVIGEEDASRDDYQKTENDNFIIQGVQGSEYAMGYLGYAYYQQNEDSVKAAPVNGVEPTMDTISSGEYPLSRPLFFYVNVDHLKDKPELREFVKFYLEKSSSDIISDVGYVPSNDENHQEMMDKYNSAMSGTYQTDYKTGSSGGEQEKLSGQVIIDGSSTVYPVSQAMAEEFKKQHPDVKISVTSSGTGGGFQKFVEGETDINDASRPIKPSESQKCKENGVKYAEFKIATDGISVVVNQNADWINSISKDTLAEVWGPENPPQQWSGVESDWPDESVDLYGPTSASGTFDFFTENVIGEEDASRTDYQKTENDNFIIQGVQGSEYAMGYLGYAYYQQNEDTVKAVGIDGVKPTVESISSGEYPLSRPLFFYVNIDHIKEDKALREFVKFYIEESDGEIISQVGYVPSSKSHQEELMDKFEQIMDGSYEVDYKS